MNTTLLMVYGIVISILTIAYIVFVTQFWFSKDKVRKRARQMQKKAESNIILDAVSPNFKFYLNKATKARNKVVRRLILLWAGLVGILTVVVFIIALIMGSTTMMEEIAASYVPYSEGEDDIQAVEENWGVIFGYNTETDDIQTDLTSSELNNFLAILEREYNQRLADGTRGGVKYYEFYNSNPGDVKLDIHGGSGGWCACFINYCAAEAGLTAEKESTLRFCRTCGCYSAFNNANKLREEGLVSIHYCRNTGGYKSDKVQWYNGISNADPKCEYTPQPGDIVIFNWYEDNGTCTYGHKAHIGAVLYTEDGIVYTMEGNTSRPGYYAVGNDDSFVEIKNRGAGCARGWAAECWYITPNYKITGGSGAFDINNYTKSGDWYDQETVKQAIYDFCISELGYNSAAACGVIGNINFESSFLYDKVEYVNDGKIYWYKNDKFAYNMPTYKDGGNGNYRSLLSDFIKVTALTGGEDDPTGTYYKSGSSKTKYGHGYGIIQWSFGRTVNLFNFCEEFCGERYGPDTFEAQLNFMKYELEHSYKKDVHDKLLEVSNDEAGAREAAMIWAQYYEVCPSKYREDRQDKASEFWQEWGNKLPTSGSSSANRTSSSTWISETFDTNITIIGGNEALMLYNNRTAVWEANIYAHSDGCVSNFGSLKNSTVGQTTIPKKTIYQAIGQTDISKLKKIVIIANALDVDELSHFKKKLNKLLDEIEDKNSEAKVFICNVPYGNVEYTTVSNDDITTLNLYINDCISDYTGTLTLKLIDVNNGVSTDNMSTESGHGHQLNTSGYSKLANLIMQNCN